MTSKRSHEKSLGNDIHKDTSNVSFDTMNHPVDEEEILFFDRYNEDSLFHRQVCDNTTVVEMNDSSLSTSPFLLHKMAKPRSDFHPHSRRWRTTALAVGV